MPEKLPFSVLIVDDEPNIRSGLAKGLANEVDFVDTASSVHEAIEKFDAGDYQLVITDVRMPGEQNGLDLVSLVQQRKPETTSIVITAHGTVESAVEAMKRGAFDFITKPVDLNLIRQQVAKAAEHYRLRNENLELRSRLAAAGEISGIIGNCGALQEVLEQIRQVAPTDATVLIQGESGTGKELMARAIHDLSGRAGGPFVAMNLGALPESLLESELFGHEKGSFTERRGKSPVALNKPLVEPCFSMRSPKYLQKVRWIFCEFSKQEISLASVVRRSYGPMHGSSRQRIVISRNLLKKGLFARICIIG